MAVIKEWIPDQNGSGHYLLKSDIVKGLQSHSNGFSDVDLKEDIAELEEEERKAIEEMDRIAAATDIDQQEKYADELRSLPRNIGRGKPQRYIRPPWKK